MSAQSGTGRGLEPESTAYVVLSTLLMLFVAVAATNWENHTGSDAWEYHRAIVALTRDMSRPGNPTFAVDVPSIRYSPYTVGLAWICRATGLDPFRALWLGSVFNTLLFVTGLRAWLRSYDATDIAPYALVVTLTLWGGLSMFASIWALSRFPMNSLSPSMFAQGLCFLMWAWLRRSVPGGMGCLRLAGVALVGTIATLSHPITGTFSFAALFLVAAAAERRRGWALVGAGCSAVAALVLCSLWPWYDFLGAVFGSVVAHDQNAAYWRWLDMASVKRMWVVWGAPAILLSPLAVAYRSRPIVRFCLFGAVCCFLFALLALVRPSLTLERLPILGMIFLHVPIAVWMQDGDVLSPRKWPSLARDLWNGDRGTSLRAGVRVLALVEVASCLLPQLHQIAVSPYIARPQLAPLFGKTGMATGIRPSLARLLAPVAPSDTVISDVRTSWMIPSIRGKVVAALHFEFFVPRQLERVADVRTFFEGGDDAARISILEKYDVRWILLAKYRIGDAAFEDLLQAEAVSGIDGPHVLMDVDRWRAAR